MNNEQLAKWLLARHVEPEAVKSILDTTDQIRNLFADAVKIGAAIPHEVWLEDITTTGRGSSMNQVVWFLLGLTESTLAYAELVDWPNGEKSNGKG